MQNRPSWAHSTHSWSNCSKIRSRD